MLYRQHGPNTEKFLESITSKKNISSIMSKYGKMGVEALKNNTPKDTGYTADSWDYIISDTEGGTQLSWVNNNTVNGTPVAVFIIYGHCTNNGEFVEGIPFTQCLIPIMEKLNNELMSLYF